MENYIILEEVTITGMMSIPGQSGRIELMKLVNQKMKEGYIPIGGVAVTMDQHRQKTYYQAMVKKESLN